MLDRALPVLEELAAGMSAVRVIGALDHSFAWDGERLVGAGDDPGPR